MRRISRAAPLLDRWRRAVSSKMLEVDEPGRVPVDALDDPTLAVILTNGVIGDLECAWSSYAAGVGDDLRPVHSGVGKPEPAQLGLTAHQPDDASYSRRVARTRTALYGPLHTARFQAEDVFKRLDEWTDAQVPTRCRSKRSSRCTARTRSSPSAKDSARWRSTAALLMKPKEVLQLAKQRFTEGLALAVHGEQHRHAQHGERSAWRE